MAILDYIIFYFKICSGQEVKVPFYGVKVEQIDESAKSHVIVITSTTMKEIGSMSSLNINNSIILAIQQASMESK